MNLTRIGGVLLALALPFAVTGVASASPHTSLTLTISSPEGVEKVVELECDPAGGTHPNAKAACVALHRAHGDFGALPDQQPVTSCTLEYRPVTATAQGTWHGHAADWTQEFGNDCALSAATGSVFRF
jgi:hypothetical protein